MLVAGDIVLNVLAGGYWYMTISGRIGYHANFANHRKTKKWKRAQKYVDWMLFPTDGPMHCYNAYVKTHNKAPVTEHSTYRVNMILLIVLPGSVLLGSILRAALFVKSVYDHAASMWRVLFKKRHRKDIEKT